MKVFDKRASGDREVELSQAVSESVQRTHGDGELERMREQMNNQADALGKLFQYVIKGDHSEAAKLALVGEVLSYSFKLTD